MKSSNDKNLKWAISISDDSKDELGWCFSLSGVMDSFNTMDHFQLESYLKFNLGERFTVIPRLVHSSSRITAFLVQSNWSLQIIIAFLGPKVPGLLLVAEDGKRIFSLKINQNFHIYSIFLLYLHYADDKLFLNAIPNRSLLNQKRKMVKLRYASLCLKDAKGGSFHRG